MVNSSLPVPAEEFELVRRARQEDVLAFAELMRRYRDRIISCISRAVPNEEEALDVYQRACVKVWQGITKFECRCSFYTWLYIIASREATT
jgi:RNA polymerase sigma-70 factor, ECF subfamily